METKEGMEAARGLGDQGRRVGYRAMGSREGYVSRGVLQPDSGFPAELVAAVGRSPVWAGRQDSIHQETVRAVGVESGQHNPVPTAMVHCANKSCLLLSKVPTLTLGEAEPGEQASEAIGPEASLAPGGEWGGVDLDGADLDGALRRLCLVTVRMALHAWATHHLIYTHGPPDP